MWCVIRGAERKGNLCLDVVVFESGNAHPSVMWALHDIHEAMRAIMYLQDAIICSLCCSSDLLMEGGRRGSDTSHG